MGFFPSTLNGPTHMVHAKAAPGKEKKEAAGMHHASRTILCTGNKARCDTLGCHVHLSHGGSKHIMIPGSNLHV